MDAGLVDKLASPVAADRLAAAMAVQRMGECAEPFLPLLADLLADPEPEVRQRAIWAFKGAGATSVPVLRQVRRGAGRRRRAALTALADVGGWDALDEADQRVVARLIEIKSINEVPEPMHLCGTWYALPTTDQAAVLDAFDLTNPRLVTMRMGSSAWTNDQHNFPTRNHKRCRRMYVTPALDGWTLVFGNIPSVLHAFYASLDAPPDQQQASADEREESLIGRCAWLSERFGAAQTYWASCGDSDTGWCIAEAGTVVRFYAAFDPDSQLGDPHPAEAGYLLPHEPTPFPEGAFDDIANNVDAYFARYRRLKEELNIPDHAHATTVAARLSVDPSGLGPATQVEGRAVLALTECGTTMPSADGALAI